MSVILKQFDGGAIAPRDDAILYNSIITRNGILNGCTITHLGANQIKITAGRGIIKGRMFEVEEMTVNCQLASAGTQKGRMYLRMELSNMENPAQIKTVAADTLPELVQEEDCNYTNGIYELELCTYDVTDTLLSNLKTTYEVIDTVFPVAKTLDDVNGVTDEDVLAGALAVKELSSELSSGYSSFSQIASCSSNSSRGSSQTYQTTQAGWYCFNAELSRQATQEDMFKCSVSVNNHKIAATSGFGDNFAAVFYLPSGITITISATFATATLYKIN